MFNSNKFNNTRGVTEPGLNLDIMNFANKYEVTDMYEPENSVDDYNRSTLKDRNCLPPSFEHEAPRRDTGSKWHLNLRHDGVWGSTESPYVHESVDTSFTDHDPRRWVPEPNLNDMVKQTIPRMSLTLWGKDADYSIPGQGIAPVDIMHRIVEARRRLKTRLQWFEESLGCIAAGKTTGATNRPSELDLINLSGKLSSDSTLEKIDPSMFDSTSTQNLNRILSNNLHMGGKYFIDRTTTDHVVPIASYNHLFRKGTNPYYKVNILEKDSLEPIKTLDKNSRARSLLCFLEAKSKIGEAVYDTKKKDSKLCQNSEASDINKDIMALLGLTYSDIKWLASRENNNQKATIECLANVIEMIEGLEKLPPNALLDIRNDLIREHAKEFMGGVSEANYNHKIKDIIESRTGVKGVQKLKINDTINTDYNLHKIPGTILSKNVYKPRGTYSKIDTFIEQLPTANYKNITRQTVLQKNNTLLKQSNLDHNQENVMLVKSMVNKVKNNTLLRNSLKTKRSEDINFGQELHFNSELKPVNMSHKKNSLGLTSYFL